MPRSTYVPPASDSVSETKSLDVFDDSDGGEGGDSLYAILGVFFDTLTEQEVLSDIVRSFKAAFDNESPALMKNYLIFDRNSPSKNTATFFNDFIGLNPDKHKGILGECPQEYKQTIPKFIEWLYTVCEEKVREQIDFRFTLNLIFLTEIFQDWTRSEQSCLCIYVKPLIGGITAHHAVVPTGYELIELIIKQVEENKFLHDKNVRLKAAKFQGPVQNFISKHKLQPAVATGSAILIDCDKFEEGCHFKPSVQYPYTVRGNIILRFLNRSNSFECTWIDGKDFKTAWNEYFKEMGPSLIDFLNQLGRANSIGQYKKTLEDKYPDIMRAVDNNETEQENWCKGFFNKFADGDPGKDTWIKKKWLERVKELGTKFPGRDREKWKQWKKLRDIITHTVDGDYSWDPGCPEDKWVDMEKYYHPVMEHHDQNWVCVLDYDFVCRKLTDNMVLGSHANYIKIWDSYVQDKNNVPEYARCFFESKLTDRYPFGNFDILQHHDKRCIYVENTHKDRKGYDEEFKYFQELKLGVKYQNKNWKISWKVMDKILRQEKKSASGLYHKYPDVKNLLDKFGQQLFLPHVLEGCKSELKFNEIKIFSVDDEEFLNSIIISEEEEKIKQALRSDYPLREILNEPNKTEITKFTQLYLEHFQGEPDGRPLAFDLFLSAFKKLDTSEAAWDASGEKLDLTKPLRMDVLHRTFDPYPVLYMVKNMVKNSSSTTPMEYCVVTHHPYRVGEYFQYSVSFNRRNNPRYSLVFKQHKPDTKKPGFIWYQDDEFKDLWNDFEHSGRRNCVFVKAEKKHEFQGEVEDLTNTLNMEEDIHEESATWLFGAHGPKYPNFKINSQTLYQHPLKYVVSKLENQAGFFHWEVESELKTMLESVTAKIKNAPATCVAVTLKGAEPRHIKVISKMKDETLQIDHVPFWYFPWSEGLCPYLATPSELLAAFYLYLQRQFSNGATGKDGLVLLTHEKSRVPVVRESEIRKRAFFGGDQQPVSVRMIDQTHQTDTAPKFTSTPNSQIQSIISKFPPRDTTRSTDLKVALESWLPQNDADWTEQLYASDVFFPLDDDPVLKQFKKPGPRVKAQPDQAVPGHIQLCWLDRGGKARLHRVSLEYLRRKYPGMKAAVALRLYTFKVTHGRLLAFNSWYRHYYSGVTLQTPEKVSRLQTWSSLFSGATFHQLELLFKMYTDWELRENEDGVGLEAWATYQRDTRVQNIDTYVLASLCKDPRPESRHLLRRWAKDRGVADEAAEKLALCPEICGGDPKFLPRWAVTDLPKRYYEPNTLLLNVESLDEKADVLLMKKYGILKENVVDNGPGDYEQNQRWLEREKRRKHQKRRSSVVSQEQLNKVLEHSYPSVYQALDVVIAFMYSHPHTRLDQNILEKLRLTREVLENHLQQPQQLGVDDLRAVRDMLAKLEDWRKNELGSRVIAKTGLNQPDTESLKKETNLSANLLAIWFPRNF